MRTLLCSLFGLAVVVALFSTKAEADVFTYGNYAYPGISIYLGLDNYPATNSPTANAYLAVTNFVFGPTNYAVTNTAITNTYSIFNSFSLSPTSSNGTYLILNNFIFGQTDYLASNSSITNSYSILNSFNLGQTTNNVAAVPSPETFLLFGAGFAAFVAWHWRADRHNKSGMTC